ncbi:Prefoldin [Entamoeba marina]
MTEKQELHDETNAALTQATEFKNQVHNDMKIIDERIESHRIKQIGYQSLLTHINSVNSATKEVLVDIGEGVHVKSTLTKTKTLLVGIGLGFYLESSFSEAKMIADKQIARIEGEIQHDLYDLAKRKATLTLTSQGADILQTTSSE